ncbi:electron transport complex subunit C [Acrasis kona]|uniref:Electron transport complex subunit C n=1 Tax=Acrasis kona TaxID=1008807 RepID=A0AAW2YRN0_9EUKA
MKVLYITSELITDKDLVSITSFITISGEESNDTLIAIIKEALKTEDDVGGVRIDGIARSLSAKLLMSLPVNTYLNPYRIITAPHDRERLDLLVLRANMPSGYFSREEFVVGEALVEKVETFMCDKEMKPSNFLIDIDSRDYKYSNLEDLFKIKVANSRDHIVLFSYHYSFLKRLQIFFKS